MASMVRYMSATKVSVFFLFICIEFDSLTGGYDQANHVFSMSYEAQRGDDIKTLYYREDEQFTSNISPTDIQSPILFGVGTCGELSVLDTQVYFTKNHINTASHNSRRSDSITENVHKHLKTKTDILQFPRRVYMGYLHHSMGQFSVLGIESLFARTSDGASHTISYKLDGKGCDDINLDPFKNNGREEHLVRFRHHMPEMKYHLTVLAQTLNGTMGHTHLWIYANRSLLEIDVAKHKSCMDNITNINMSTQSGTTLDDINTITRCLVLEIDQKGTLQKERFPDHFNLKVVVRVTLILVPLCLIFLVSNIIMCLHSCVLVRNRTGVKQFDLNTGG